jgi:hypothetical protein
MKSDSENFEELRKLMALARHELPPPGYFNRLPASIISRIERGEGQLSFWERLATNFTVRPAFAYAFALAACGALTTSVYSVKSRAHDTAYQPPSNSGWRIASSDDALGFNPAKGPYVATWLGSTNPEAPSMTLPSLFDVPYRTVQVNYQR